MGEGRAGFPPLGRPHSAPPASSLCARLPDSFRQRPRLLGTWSLLTHVNQVCRADGPLASTPRPGGDSFI